MKAKLKLNVALVFITLVNVSCKNYYISKESFLNQFSNVDSSTLRNVTVQGPLGTITKYKANSINPIKCVDKNGTPAELSNSPSIETRITLNNNKRIVFYFDRVIMKDSIVYGIQSRFLGLKTSIPIKDITKIEVQDGRKNFRYLSID